MNVQERTKRLKQAIAETERFIEKESARADDLRPVQMQELLEWYKGHRAKLIGWLAECEG